VSSTQFATDGNGTVVGSNQPRDYAYGRERMPSVATLPTDYRFTGQKLDGTGLVYMNARYYDPQLGTFISPDSLVPDATSLADYNRYLYAHGNPMRYNDPSGHCIGQGQKGWDSAENGQCYFEAHNIADLGGLDYIQKYFGGGYKSVDQWLNTALTDPGLDNNFLHPHSDSLYQSWCGGAGLRGQGGCSGSYTANPMGPQTFPLPDVTLPDCSKVDCTSLLINNSVVGLDKASVYAAGGAVSVQSVAFGCAAIGFIPCVGAAEGVAGTLATVSTVASVVGTGLTAVQVVRNQAPAKDLAVSLTSTLLGAQGSAYFGNAGASTGVAKLVGAATGFGASLLQEQYDTK